MNDLIAIPTVEQINLEHQLANSKAHEAVQHATNCGLMLLQVKASKEHGEWLPWLNGEIESGRLKVEKRQAQRYMRLGSNTSCMTYLEPKSINAALELLSDKEPDAEQSPLIPADVEAERKAREEAAAELEAEKQRSSEWRDQWKKQRDETEQTLGRLSIALQEKSELQFKLRALENQPAPKPQVVEKAPDDYEEFKCKAVEFQQQTDALQQQLATLQKQQARLVNDQVKAKLQEREYRATSPPARAQRSRLNARPG